MVLELLVIAALGGGLAWLGWSSSQDDADPRSDPDTEAWEDLVGRLRD